jgi:hypothetical protein
MVEKFPPWLIYGEEALVPFVTWGEDLVGSPMLDRSKGSYLPVILRGSESLASQHNDQCRMRQ